MNGFPAGAMGMVDVEDDGAPSVDDEVALSTCLTIGLGRGRGRGGLLLESVIYGLKQEIARRKLEESAKVTAISRDGRAQTLIIQFELY